MVAQQRFSSFNRIGCLAVLAAMFVPSAAWAEFGTPFPLSPADYPAQLPQVVTDSDGDALIIWEQEDSLRLLRVTARARSKGGALGPRQNLSGAAAGPQNPQVAMDADGDALVVWFRNGSAGRRIQARSHSAGGSLGSIETLSGIDAFHPQVAMDAAGDALVVWQRTGSDSRIQARFRSAAGAFGPVQNISAPGGNDSQQQVALDADGDALIIWTHPDGVATRLQARSRSEAGVLGPIQNISAADRTAEVPQVAIDADGDALFVWYQFDGALGYRVHARARAKTGALGPHIVIAKSDSFGPQVAMEPGGDALVVWERQIGANSQIEARPITAAGVLGPVRILSGTNAFQAQVAMEPGGDAVVVWTLNNGTNRQTQARTRSAGGALGAIQTLSPTAVNRDTGAAQVAVDAEGDALAVWARRFADVPSNERIEAVAGP